MNWSQKVVDKLPLNPCRCSVKFDWRSFLMTSCIIFRHVGIEISVIQYITPVELPTCTLSESLANVIQMLHSRPLAEFSLRVQ